MTHYHLITVPPAGLPSRRGLSAESTERRGRD
jgi:hypothetical protein